MSLVLAYEYDELPCDIKEILFREARRVLRLMEQGLIVITGLYEYRCMEEEQSEDP